VDKKKPTRDRLIEAAVQLFWEKGYGGTSMAELLAAAGVNSGSFYYFFDSKEDLLLAVLDWYAENIYPALLEPVYSQIHDPIGRIFGLLDRYRGLIIQTECTYGCPIGRLALEISPEQRRIHQRIADNFEGWAAAVRKCLDDARDRLPPDVDREKLSRFVLTVMEGGVMQSRSHRTIGPFDQSVEMLRDYFSRLLGDETLNSPKTGDPKG
jgi:TetR/AcrR family transcriptional repressor of nem operon